jgi:hypothetical protein
MMESNNDMTKENISTQSNKEAVEAFSLANNREAIFEIVSLRFNHLVSFVNNLPIHPQIKSHANLNLDQGLFWLHQGISNLENKSDEDKKKNTDENQKK